MARFTNSYHDITVSTHAYHSITGKNQSPVLKTYLLTFPHTQVVITYNKCIYVLNRFTQTDINHLQYKITHHIKGRRRSAQISKEKERYGSENILIKCPFLNRQHIANFFLNVIGSDFIWFPPRMLFEDPIINTCSGCCWCTSWSQTMQT